MNIPLTVFQERNNFFVKFTLNTLDFIVMQLHVISFFFQKKQKTNWESLHARLNSHYNAWSYKKQKHKKIETYRKSV